MVIHMKTSTVQKEFLRYASLNVMGMLGLSCYILADTFFVANGLGADGLTALNLAIPVYSVVHGCGLMLGCGGGTCFSVAKAGGDGKRGNGVYTHTLVFAAVLATMFFLGGVCFSPAITAFMGADTSVFTMTETYIRVILLFSPFYLLNEVLLGFVRNDNAPNLAMIAMLGGSFANIVLDYLFVFPMRMGMFGAVLATGFAPIVSLLLMLPRFLRRRNGFRVTRCTPQLSLGGKIAALGAPSLVTEVSSGVVMMVFNAILLRLGGNVGVAAYGIIANIALVVLAMYTGIAQGCQPLFSQLYGAGETEGVCKCFRYAIVAVVLMSVAVYAGVFFFATPIAAVFNREGNGELQRIAEEGLRVYFIGGVFAGLNVVFSGFLAATERALSANVFSLLRGFALVIPGAFFLSDLWGITGLWCVFPAVEGCVFLGFALRLGWNGKRAEKGS